MKTLLTALTSVSLLFTSCGTFDNSDGTVNQARLSQITALVETGSRLATTQALASDSGSKYTYAFQIASDTIEAAVDGSNFNPNYIDVLLRSELDDKLQNAQVALVYDTLISLATSQYRVFYDANVAKYSDDNPIYAAFLTSIKDGIDSGLASVSSKSVLVAGPKANPLVKLTKRDLTL